MTTPIVQTTSATPWGRRVLGEGMGRPLLAFAAAVALVVASMPEPGRLPDALAVLVLVGLFLVPPFVFDAELVRRFAIGSWRRRAVAGAVAFGGWCLVVATVAVVLSRVPFTPRALLGPLAVSIAIGAMFSAVAFRCQPARAGLALIVLALLVVVIVVAAGVALAGRWGANAV